ncbi:hypothetical protein AVEN_186568-1 [Araneus ventricosus]|uniref:Uncharacterized protein n=1 Tax=Araneus ventricosus TaxID=182803 RepID=A0A4Y2KK78_ARAVE|nr:hypothetical protein AVEN_186568-1 [Araneus ventricosus]
MNGMKPDFIYRLWKTWGDDFRKKLSNSPIGDILAPLSRTHYEICTIEVDYANFFESLNSLEENMRRVVTNIQSDSLRAAVENVIRRIQYLVQREGQHTENIVRGPGDSNVD